MSWQAYVDTSLVGTGKIDRAAIFSKAGDSVWATSHGFDIKPDEIKRVVQGFADPGSMLSNGILISSEKYVAIQAESKQIVGKKGKEGIICVLTEQALLVAHHSEHITTPEALGAVAMLQDYLIKLKY